MALQRIDFNGLMARVALELLGEPKEKRRGGREWRYGNRGSLSIDVEKDCFHDHERGAGGGVIELVQHCCEMSRAHAVEYLRKFNGVELRPAPAATSPKPAPRKQIGKQVAAYQYRDEAGVLLFEVVRYEPKDFRQRRPGENGEWIWRLDDVRRVLYRLQETIAAAEKGGAVFIVEGEKDADRLCSLGLVATTCPGGAGKWLPQYNGVLRGADVVVIHDNDDTGRAHAKRIVDSLTGTAKRVRVLDIAKRWPECPDKGDISKWLDNGGNTEKLIKFISELGQQTTGKRLVVCSANEVTPEPVEWLWTGRVAVGKTTLIGGDPGLGKSQLSISIAATISNGGQWPCQEGRAPKRSIIMLSAEDGVADTIVPRLMAAGADLEKIKVVTAVHEADGKGRRIFNLTKDLDALESLIAETGDVGLVTIDPVDAYIGGGVDSHKNAAVRAVLEPLSELADRVDVGVLALTHFSKQAGNGKAIYRFIGSIAHIGSARVGFAVVADPEDETRVLVLHTKNNLAAPPKGLAFRIEQHLVAEGIIGSCIVFDTEHVTGLSADDVLGAENQSATTRSAKDDAIDFLRLVLAKGRVGIRDIEAEARAAGLLGEGRQLRESKPFRSASDELGIIKEHEGFGSDAVYYWSLPLHVRPSSPYVPSQKEGTYEGEGAHGQCGESTR